MANPESKQLAIDVIARVDKLEKSMAKARKATNDNFQKMETRGQRFQAKMAGIGRTAFSGFAAGATAALAPMALFSKTLNEIAKADKIGKVADKVGLTTTELQQLRHVAELAGVDVAQMDTAMQRFSRRVAEAASGSGELRKVLEANGVELRNADGTMRSQRDILRDYANLIKNAGSEQERLLLAFKAFDTEGAALVNLFKDGSDAIDTMAAKTEKAGGVIDEKLVRRAEELNDKFTVLWRNFDINSANAILTAADAIDTLTSKANQFGNSSFFQWLSGKLGTDGAVFVPGEGVFTESDQASPSARVVRAFQGAVQEADADLVKALQERYGAATKQAAQTVIPGGDTGTGGTTNKSLSRDLERASRVIEQLEHERALIGATNLEREKMNALRAAGALATEQEKAKIESLVTAIYMEQQALDAAAEAAAELRDIGRETMGGFISDMLAGKDAADALADALRNIGDRLINSGLDALFGTGSGGGILGGLKIPGFASGTNYAPGGLALVGERGPEIVNLPRGSQVIPNHLSIPALKAGSAGGSVAVPVNVTIDARGADREGLARVEQQVARLRAELPATVVHTVRVARQQRKL